MRTSDLNPVFQPSYPLVTSRDLDPLLERIGEARCVLLGEASHGTHDYYTWRTAITQRLIAEKNFRLLAVEGDWPDCYRINRYIKGLDNTSQSPVEILQTFKRWPTWMWGNWEIAALVSWLKTYNTTLSPTEKIGFYGLDVYSLWESMEAMVGYLEGNDPVAARLVHEALACFEPFAEDEQRYAREHYFLGVSCRDPLTQLLRQIRSKVPSFDHDPEAALNTEQNAYIAVNAEAYYRGLMDFSTNTWNLRDTHMADTLDRLLRFQGPDTKIIVWAHNTHIGDARYTSMPESGLINLGQLVRQRRGMDDVVLVGFSSYQGTVRAGKRWGAPAEVMTVPAAQEGSLEHALHQLSDLNRLIIFARNTSGEPFPHRAIGVVYEPERERFGNYVSTKVNQRYDAFVYLDRTRALHPLPLSTDAHKIPETFPFNY